MSTEENKEKSSSKDTEGAGDFDEVNSEKDVSLTLSLNKNGVSDVKMKVNEKDVDYKQNIKEVEEVKDSENSNLSYRIWCEKNKDSLDNPDFKEKFNEENKTK